VIIDLPPIEPAQAAIGHRLRRVREARGLTTGRLAQACNLAPSRLGLAEQGRARLTSVELHALICALHIPLGLLMAPQVDVSRLRPL
jgi:transcriptional regulator with XRE-family HTH domain